MLAIGAVAGVGYLNSAANRDEGAERRYLKDHPLTDAQVAANNHFSACWQYRRASPLFLPERQRSQMLRAGVVADEDGAERQERIELVKGESLVHIDDLAAF